MPGCEAAWGAWETENSGVKLERNGRGLPMYGLFHVKQFPAVWSLGPGPEGVELVGSVIQLESTQPARDIQWLPLEVCERAQGGFCCDEEISAGEKFTAGSA